MEHVQGPRKKETATSRIAKDEILLKTIILEVGTLGHILLTAQHSLSTAAVRLTVLR